jgi:tetratricopeptide (TPR) repeat protein
MRRFINWMRNPSHVSAEKQTLPAVEWIALEKAILAHDFATVSPALRAWCRLPESSLTALQELANRAEYNSVEANKIEILFEYYSRKMDVAFDRAQLHMKAHGFDPDLHVISVVSLYQNNQFKDAQTYLSRLSDVELSNMNRADYWQIVSVIRWAANDMDTLEQAADRALELAPYDSAILETALGMYIELGAQEKVNVVRARLATRPDAAGYAHSLSLLALGEYELGWLQMEGRYEIEDVHRYINQGLRSKPRWQGESLVGARLMLSAEQGLGDTIQMARYLPMLRSLKAQGVFLETQPETLTLLQHNFPDIPMVERRWEQAPKLDFDVWTGMMSLPHLLKAWGNATPGRSGYLSTPPENTQYWKERVEQLSPTRKPRIGLAWSGQPNHRADRRRSVPFELMMRKIRGLQVIFFALQTSVPQILPVNVMNVTEEMITLADTAALIEQMDLVITVDTSVVHIAGALGKPTWLLLPKRYEWRWGMEGEENDWYDSVKVIRQSEHANWSTVLQDVFEHRLPEQFNI